MGEYCAAWEAERFTDCSVDDVLAWLRVNNPDIETAVVEGAVRLQSPGYSQASLRLIWKATCLNERLQGRCEQDRVDTLARLLS